MPEAEPNITSENLNLFNALWLYKFGHTFEWCYYESMKEDETGENHKKHLADTTIDDLFMTLRESLHE